MVYLTVSMDDHKLGVTFELNICSNWDRVECVRSRKYHNCRNIFLGRLLVKALGVEE